MSQPMKRFRLGPEDEGDDPGSPRFSSQFVLNQITPIRIVLNSDDVYVTQDTSLTNTAATSITLNLTDLGRTGFSKALAYGTQDNVEAVLAGGDGNSGALLFLSTATTPAPGSLTPLPLIPAPVPVASHSTCAPKTVFTSPTGQPLRHDRCGKIICPADREPHLTRVSSGRHRLRLSRTTALMLVDRRLSTTPPNAQSTLASPTATSPATLSNWRLFGAGLPNTSVSAFSTTTRPTLLRSVRTAAAAGSPTTSPAISHRRASCNSASPTTT